ncbi:MAG: hypothetical protein AB7I19_16185 [Planctomycetota bacterium]
MLSIRSLTFVAVLLLGAVARPQVAVTSTLTPEPLYFGYLELPGLQGPVTSPPAYVGWFRVAGFTLGERVDGLGGSGGGGSQARSKISTLVVDGEFAQFMPELLAEVITGVQPGHTARRIALDVFAKGNPPLRVAQIVLDRAVVIDIGADGRTLSGTQLEFLFDRVTWTYFVSSSGQQFSTTWDLGTNGTPQYRETSVPFAAVARATYEAVMEVPGVVGESSRAGYRQWIDCTDVVSGIHRADPNDLRPQAPRVTVRAYLQRGWQDLARSTMNLSSFARVRIHVIDRANPRGTALELTLHNAKIERLWQHAGAGGAAVEIDFAMERIEWVRRDPITGAISARGCWNFLTNVQC